MTRNRARRTALIALAVLLALGAGGCGKPERKPGASGLPVTTTSAPSDSATGDEGGAGAVEGGQSVGEDAGTGDTESGQPEVESDSSTGAAGTGG